MILTEVASAPNNVKLRSAQFLRFAPALRVTFFSAAATCSYAESRAFGVNNAAASLQPRRFYTADATIQTRPLKRGIPSVTFDGGERRLAEHIVPQRAVGGEVVGTIAIVMDVTESELAREALLRSERSLRDIIDAIPAYIFTCDLDGHYLTANRSLCEATGVDEQSLRGRRFSDFVFAADIEVWCDAATTAATLRKPAAATATLRFPDGTLRTAEGTFSPLFGNEGEVVALAGAFVDVTERLRSADSLRRLMTAVDQAADIVFTTDAAGRITYVNPAFTHLYGYSAREMLGLTPRVLKSGVVSDEEYRTFWRNIQAGKIVRGEIINRTKAGALVSVNRAVSPISGEDGAITGYVCVQTDVTEARRIEAEQAAMRERLFQFAKLEAIGTLAGGIAHDFNNILAIILSFCAVAERSARNPERFADAMRTIRAAINRGSALTKQVLTFARKSDGSPAAVNVNEVVREVVTMLEATLPKTISIEACLADAIPLVIGDASKIHEAILNLCLNARDAMPSGGVLTLATATVLEPEPGGEANKDYVRITVADTGTGIAPEIADRVFEPFFSTKPKDSGTGLGLSVAFGVAQSSGGFIRFDTEHQRGTSFHVCLPVATTAEEIPERRGGPQEYDGNETVLLVEDEPAIGPFFVDTLSDYGYTVLLAPNGAEALNTYRLAADRIDIVVTDAGLPGISGTALFYELRRQDPQLPIVLASGYVDPSELERLRQFGLSGFLQKPFGIEELVRTIRQVCDQCVMTVAS